MTTMKAIVLITCIISLISGVLDGLKPDGKFDKQMQLLLTAVFLLSVLTPLAKGANALTETLFTEQTVSSDVTDAVVEATVTVAAENLSQTLTELLQTQGISEASVVVSMHRTADNSIEIEQIEAKCNSENLEKAETLLTDSLGEEVVLYVGTAD